MKKSVIAAVASLCALAVSMPVLAQTVSEGDADIIVTATRNETLLSKTPITMTALGGESLRDAGITDARSLQSSVPNLAFTESGDTVRISIRGVTSTDTTEKGDPSAAFLMDGIYIARSASMLGSFYDLDRVEVLRGPQGTLYGRNATAGVINVISKRPVDQFEASLDGSYGRFGQGDVTGMVNVPLGAGLAMRAAVNYQVQDKPYYKLVTPDTVNRGVFRDEISGRLSLGGTIGDNFTFVIRGDYSRIHGYGANGNMVTLDRFFSNINVPLIDPTPVNRGGDYKRTLTMTPDYPSRRDETNWGVMADATYDFGPAQLTYLASYRRAKRANSNTQLLFGAFYNPVDFVDDFRQQSHELRLSFGQDNPLHGQAGIYYFRETGSRDYNIFNPLAGIVAPDAINYAFKMDPAGAKSTAAFGTLTYDITPDLHITGGIRHTRDRKWRSGQTVLDFPDAASVPGTPFICNNQTALPGGEVRCTVNQNIASRKFRKTTWKAGIDYDAPGLGLIYASVSTGYKAGGFNDGCITGEGTGCELTAEALYYNPETLTAYEMGFKFRFGPAFRLNGALFHYDYKNMQLNQAVIVPVPGTRITNAASSKVDGVELEAVVQPGPNDRFDLSFTYTDARYGDFHPDLVSHPTLNLKGRQLDHAPKYTVNTGYAHTFPMGNGGEIVAGIRSRFSASYQIIDLNNLSFFRQRAYTKTDATLTYTAPEGSWYVQGFVKNIENEVTVANASTGIVSLVSIEAPRTYGVRAGVKF
ncbi:MAG: TonB-dependent receptor [Sphingobium sp.]